MVLSDLCLDCGLCCNGTLFSDFIIAKDEFKYFGKANNTDDHLSIKQPCNHLDEQSLCKIYKNRPNVCKSFKCGILKEVSNKIISIDHAKSLINKLKANPLDEKLKNRFKFNIC